MSRPELTISEAAEACGVSAKTIRRRLKAGEFPGSHQDGAGENAPWLIPIEALEFADGLHPNAPSTPNQTFQEPTTVGVPDVTDALDELSDQLTQVEAEAIEWRRRAEVAEAVAEERSAALGDLRIALDLAQRQLTAGEPSVQPQEPTTETTATTPSVSANAQSGRLRAAWQALRGRS